MIGPSVLQTDGSFQHVFGIPHTFSMASCQSFTPALVRDIIMQVGIPALCEFLDCVESNIYEKSAIQLTSVGIAHTFPFMCATCACMNS